MADEEHVFYLRIGITGTDREDAKRLLEAEIDAGTLAALHEALDVEVELIFEGPRPTGHSALALWHEDAVERHLESPSEELSFSEMMRLFTWLAMSHRLATVAEGLEGIRADGVGAG